MVGCGAWYLRMFMGFCAVGLFVLVGVRWYLMVVGFGCFAAACFGF